MEHLIAQIERYIPYNAQEERDKAQILAALRSGKDLITRENPVMHLTASAWVVSPDRSQVVMVYHNLYRSWSWMGGHADGDWAWNIVSLKSQSLGNTSKYFKQNRLCLELNHCLTLNAPMLSELTSSACI